jgi:hypothetical protein
MISTDMKAFMSWLRQCQSLAMSSEWCIDPDNEDWLKWFNEGLTPEQAVDKLFEEIREEI